MTKAAVLGVVLASVVLAVGTYGGGGLDGPCLGGDWARSFGEATGARARPSSWPPGIRCTVTAVNGAVVGDRVHPGSAVWIAALLVASVPLAVAYRRQRSTPR